MFEIIDDLKNKLDQHRPLSPVIVKNLQEDLILRWTYHSNTIEGNTLILLETKVVLRRHYYRWKSFTRVLRGN